MSVCSLFQQQIFIMGLLGAKKWATSLFIWGNYGIQGNGLCRFLFFIEVSQNIISMLENISNEGDYDESILIIFFSLHTEQADFSEFSLDLSERRLNLSC